MPLFARKKEAGAQAFVVALLNENCSALKERIEGPRLEGRVNLTLVVSVVPLDDGKPAVRKAFYATSKEFSASGVALMVDHPCGIEEAVLGFNRRGTMVWLRAKARHLYPMGGGFFQLGFRLLERIEPSDFPELAKISL
jgi:hypothetical protein